MSNVASTAPGQTRSARTFLGLRPETTRRWLPGVVMIVILAVLVLPAIAVLIRTSVTNQDSGVLTFAYYAGIFADPRLYQSTLNSIVFALLAMALSVSFGGSIAWLVERTNTPWRALAPVTAIISLGSPYVLYVAAWLFLLGRSGPFNVGYQALTGSRDLLLDVNSMWGMVLIEGMLWSPLVFLLLSPVFRRANAEMEEAARMCGASVLQTTLRISMRLAAPAILGTGLFVVVRNLESFDVPVLVGMPGGVNVLTTNIYQDMTQIPPRLGGASAFSVLLIALVSVLLMFYGRISRNADRFASISGKAYRPRTLDLGPAKWAGTALVLIFFFVVLVMPMAALLWQSLLPFVRPIGLRSLPMLTLNNYAQVIANTHYLDLAWNTILVSAAAATAAMALTVIAGWLSVRRWPGGALINQLANMPLVFPGIVLAVALIEISLRLPLPIYGTLWVIFLGFLIRYMPYGMRYSYSGVMQIHKELEEAAAISGGTQFTVLRRIVAPLLSPAIMTGWLFIFLLGAKELSMAVLLSGSNSQTMAVAIFDEMANGQAVEVAALGILWTAFLALCAVSLHFIGRRHQDSTGN